MTAASSATPSTQSAVRSTSAAWSPFRRARDGVDKLPSHCHLNYGKIETQERQIFHILNKFSAPEFPFYLGSMVDDCVPDLQIAPARMTCPRRTRFNAATKTCDSMRAVPCDAKGNIPKPNVAAGGSSSSGVESGIAKSE